MGGGLVRATCRITFWITSSARGHSFAGMGSWTLRTLGGSRGQRKTAQQAKLTQEQHDAVAALVDAIDADRSRHHTTTHLAAHRRRRRRRRRRRVSLSSAWHHLSPRSMQRDALPQRRTMPTSVVATSATAD